MFSGLTQRVPLVNKRGIASSQEQPSRVPTQEQSARVPAILAAFGQAITPQRTAIGAADGGRGAAASSVRGQRTGGHSHAESPRAAAPDAAAATDAVAACGDGQSGAAAAAVLEAAAEADNSGRRCSKRPRRSPATPDPEADDHMEAEAAEEWLPAAAAAAAAAAPSASQRRAAKARAGARKRVKRAKLSAIARSSTASGSFAPAAVVLAPYTPRRKAAARADALRLEAQQPARPVRKPPAPQAASRGESVHSMQLSAPLSGTAAPCSATAAQRDDHTSAARGVTAARPFQAHTCLQQLGPMCNCIHGVTHLAILTVHGVADGSGTAMGGDSLFSGHWDPDDCPQELREEDPSLHHIAMVGGALL